MVIVHDCQHFYEYIWGPIPSLFVKLKLYGYTADS